MSKPALILLAALALASFSTESFAYVMSAKSCSQLFSEREYRPDDLRVERESDIAGLFKFQVRRLNSRRLKELANTTPVRQSKDRATSVSWTQLQSLLEEATKSPVVGRSAKEKYAREGTEIGYCFGRATYFHLMLLKMGLDKGAIRKAWVVGPQKSGLAGVTWSFHVATVVHVKGYGWMAIDSNTFKILPLETWANGLHYDSLDGKSLLYVTEANRFSVASPVYSREMMGLDLPVDQDWFRHYFKDLVADVASADLEARGLAILK